MRTFFLYHSFLLLAVFAAACHNKQSNETKIEKGVAGNKYTDTESKIYPNDDTNISDSNFINFEREIYSGKTTRLSDKLFVLDFNNSTFKVKEEKKIKEGLDYSNIPSKILIRGIFSMENNIIICTIDNNHFYKLERLTTEKIKNHDMPYLEDTLYITYKKQPKEKHPSIIVGRWESGKKDGSWLISDGKRTSVIDYKNGILVNKKRK